MLKGLFINQVPARCSIYESGIMVYRALKLSNTYNLELLEIEQNTIIPENYDFYVINWHSATTPWFNPRIIKNIPKFTIGIILEMRPNNPFTISDADMFDIFCCLDPTMYENNRVFAFPRPLEIVEGLKYKENEIPTIGSFGFPTTGKSWEIIYDSVRQEFKEAIIKFHIPRSTFMPYLYMPFIREEGNKSKIKLEYSHNYMSKEELIRWCSKNTINCFFYERGFSGLCAATDQAISSGRPLAISKDIAFRHIHKYMKSWPDRSIKESITISKPEVEQMKKDWHPKKFANKFEEVLKYKGVIN